MLIWFNMYIYSDYIIRIYIHNTEYTHIYDYMHVFLSPILNSKTSDPPTVQTFYEACIVAYLSITFHILWLKTLFGSGAQIVAKSKCPMQEILHWTRSVFFFHSMSFCRILSEAINVFVVHPQRWKRSWGNTVSMQPKQQKWSLLLVFLNCLLEHAMLKAGGPLQPKQLSKSKPPPAKKKGSR